MATRLIDESRVTTLRGGEPGEGSYVLYWMQASVRTRDNHALEYAVRLANDLSRPLVVGFGLDAGYQDATGRSLRFLVDGLVDVAGGLERRNVGFVVQAGSPLTIATRLASDAAAVVVDRNYLREPRKWRAELVADLSVPVVEVESNVVVPVEQDRSAEISTRVLQSTQ